MKTKITPAETADQTGTGTGTATSKRRRRVPSLRSLGGLRRPIRLPVRVHTFDSFGIGNFRLLWAASAASSGGFFLQQVVIGWLAYDITRSAFLTSLAMGLDALPLLLAGPFGGLLVDVWDRRKLLVTMFAYQGLVALTFSVLVILDAVAVWHLFVFVLASGTAWIVIDPGRSALIAQIVPRENLMNAFSLMSLGFSLMRLAAPVLGGVLMAIAGPGPALVLQGGLILAASGLASMLSLDRPVPKQLNLRTALPEIGEALSYVRKEPVILGLLLVGALPATLAIPFANGLMPVLAAEVYEVGPTGLGILLSCIGAGATLGTIALATLGDIRRKGVLILGSAALVVACMVSLSQSGSFVDAVPLVLVLGIGVTGMLTLVGGSVQSVVRDEYRGRVGGLFTLTWGISPLGFLLAGGLAEVLTAQYALLVAGGAMATLATVILVRFPLVLRLR